MGSSIQPSVDPNMKQVPNQAENQEWNQHEAKESNQVWLLAWDQG